MRTQCRDVPGMVYVVELVPSKCQLFSLPPLQPSCFRKEDWLSWECTPIALGFKKAEAGRSLNRIFINERCLSKVSWALVSCIPQNQKGWTSCYVGCRLWKRDSWLMENFVSTEISLKDLIRTCQFLRWVGPPLRSSID